MKRKKGVSHVEIIFSFVIFISFVIFMFIVFKPLKILSSTESDLDTAENVILENISTTLSVLSLKIKSSAYDPTKPCFYINDPLNSTSVLHLIMRNATEQVINATKQGGRVYFKNSGSFYKLYYSEEFEEKALSDISACSELGYLLGSEKYILGIIKLYDIVSYSKLIIGLKEKYNGNYEQLKKEFGLRKDFNISIMDYPEAVFETKKDRPSNIDVRARDIPISILDENAGLKNTIMNLQVWG